MVKVKLFASLKERAGTDMFEMDIPKDCLVKDLKSMIVTQFPALEAAINSAIVSINNEFAFDDESIPVNAEIALFPPVSGGDSARPEIYKITDEAIDFDALIQQITLPTTGALCFFCGVVREVTLKGGKRLTMHLEYEAYEKMAEIKMQQVAQEIRERWPDVEGIAIVQRVGMLKPGTPTVMIACSAAHRDTGVFEATRYGIDRLKEIVPIWKKEVGTEDAYWVEGDYFPDRDD